MDNEKICPCCEKHCDIDSLECGRGKKYFGSDHYVSLPTDEKLAMAIRNLGHVMRFCSGGKGGQRRIMTMLEHSGTITQSELTERIGIKSGSMSEVLRKLEANSLIQRTPNQADRRTIDISLTEAGKAMVDHAKEHCTGQFETMFSCLSSEEKQQLLEMLGKLEADWAQRYAADDKPAHSGCKGRGEGRGNGNGRGDGCHRPHQHQHQHRQAGSFERRPQHD